MEDELDEEESSKTFTEELENQQKCVEGSNDVQSFNDPLSTALSTQGGFQPPATTTSDKTNPSSPTPEFRKINSSNETMESEDNLPRDNVEKSKYEVNNVKDEALWDILEVKMEPEEENFEEDAGNIPKQKYNKLKKFEGKLFRSESKSS